MSNPKISFINCIGTLPNHPTKNKIEIVDSGVNIHQVKLATSKIAPVIISNDMAAIPPNYITMDSSNLAILQIPGLSKQAWQIKIPPKIKIAPPK